MKVLYIDHYAGSETMGMEFRPYYLSKAWQESGIETTILTADYSHLRKMNPEIKQDLDEDIIDGSKFVFLRTKKYQGNGKSRIISIAQFVWKGLWYSDALIQRYVPDVVICSSTYPMDTYIGQRIKRKTGATLIHEIHDLWPLTPQLLGGYSSNHPFIKMMGISEKSAYCSSDFIVSVLPNVEGHVRSLGCNTPVIHIPNGLQEDSFQDIENLPVNQTVESTIKLLRLAGKFVIGYAGGISISNAMDDFIHAMALLKNNNRIAAVIIGSGIQKEELIRVKKDLDLDNIYFLEPIAKSEVVGSLALFDSLYIGSRPSPLYQYGVSANKIFDYMLAGRPIINAFDTIYSPLNALGNTFIAKAGNSFSIAEQIRAVSNLSEKEKKLIETDSREFVYENHNYKKLSKDFMKVFKEAKR